MRIKNLVRVISMLIALSMCMSVLILPVVSADEVAEIPEASVARYETLKSIGVLKYDLTDEMYTQNVTHAQMVGAVIDLFGDLSDYFEYSDYTVADLAGAPEANKIQLAYDLGLLGKTWMFDPSRSVNVGETVQLLISAMGYEDIARDKGGDVLGYAAVGRNIGLLDGFSKEVSANLTWIDFIQLLYNAIDIDIMKIYGYTAEGIRRTTVDDVTLLNEYFDIYVIDGVVNANERTSIEHSAAVDKGMVKIADTVMSVGNTDISDMIGYHVRGYARKAGDKYTVLYYETDGYNKIWSIDASDLMPSHNEWSMFRIVYEDERGRTKQLLLPSDVVVVYNGMYFFEYTADDIAIEMGSLDVLDNDLDGNPEVVIVSEYTNYVVDSVDVNNNLVFTKDGVKLNFDPSVTDSKLLSVNGDEYPISELSEYAVLSLEISKDNSYIRGVTSKNKRSGLMSQYRVENGEAYVYLDDEKLGISKSWESIVLRDKCIIDESSVGKRYVAYLDKNEKVAFFIEKNSGILYGFLYGCKVEGSFEPSTRIRVFTEDGVWKEYNIADEVSVFDKNSKTIKIVKSGEAGSNPNYGLVDAGKGVINQMIKIEVDENNEVKQIYSPITRATANNAGITGTDIEDKLLILEAANQNLAYRRNNGSLGSSFDYAVGGGTNVFSTPYVDDDTSGIYEFDAFEAGGTALLRDDFTNHNLDIYDLSDANVVGMLVFNRGARTYDYWLNGAYLVKNVIKEYDEDGEYTYLECINKGQEVIIRGISDDHLKNINVTGVNGTTYKTDVEPGDILSCHTNNKGLIDEVAILYDRSMFTTTASIPNEAIQQTVVGRGTSETSGYYGEVMVKENGFILVNNGSKNRVFGLNGTAYIYSVNMSERDSNKVFSSIKAAEIPVGGKVMVFTRGTMMQLIVYFVD